MSRSPKAIVRISAKSLAMPQLPQTCRFVFGQRRARGVPPISLRS
jgi:hypothetical protein